MVNLREKGVRYWKRIHEMKALKCGWCGITEIWNLFRLECTWICNIIYNNRFGRNVAAKTFPISWHNMSFFIRYSLPSRYWWSRFFYKCWLFEQLLFSLMGEKWYSVSRPRNANQMWRNFHWKLRGCFLFLTSSALNVLKLWFLRTKQIHVSRWKDTCVRVVFAFCRCLVNNGHLCFIIFS